MIALLYVLWGVHTMEWLVLLAKGHFNLIVIKNNTCIRTLKTVTCKMMRDMLGEG